MFADPRIRTCAIAIVTFVVLTVAGHSVTASTVVPMNVARLSDLSAQVIVADIGKTASAWAEHPRRIETTVQLHHVEYLKGGYQGAPTERTLVVPGGQVGTMQMRICGAPDFKTGERWLLYLLPDYKTYPTAGLGQGAFRIVTDETGTAHVFQQGGLGVSGIDAESWLEFAVDASTDAHRHLVGATPNVRLTDRSDETIAKLMTLEAFRSAIQPILDASRDHKLSRPAGRYVPLVYRPVPIRRRDSAQVATRASSGMRPMREPPRATPRKARRSAGPERSAAPRAVGESGEKSAEKREASGDKASKGLKR